MAGLHRRGRSQLLPVAVFLLLLAAAAAAAEEGDPKISVRYPSAEDSEWLDRWAAKYRKAPAGSGSAAQHGGFTVMPATDEESAHLNRMFADAKEGAAGYDGRMEWDDNDRPRIVVDAVHHSAADSSTKVDGDDDLGSRGEKARVEEL